MLLVSCVSSTRWSPGGWDGLTVGSWLGSGEVYHSELVSDKISFVICFHFMKLNPNPCILIKNLFLSKRSACAARGHCRWNVVATFWGLFFFLLSFTLSPRWCCPRVWCGTNSQNIRFLVKINFWDSLGFGLGRTWD